MNNASIASSAKRRLGALSRPAQTLDSSSPSSRRGGSSQTNSGIARAVTPGQREETALRAERHQDERKQGGFGRDQQGRSERDDREDALGDGGRAEGSVAFNGETVFADVTLLGTISVGVEVDGLVGAAPVEVVLDASGPFGGRAVPTTVEAEALNCSKVYPGRPFIVSASQVTPTAVTISATASVNVEDLPSAGTRLVPNVHVDPERRSDACGAGGRRVWRSCPVRGRQPRTLATSTC